MLYQELERILWQFEPNMRNGTRVDLKSVMGYSLSEKTASTGPALTAS